MELKSVIWTEAWKDSEQCDFPAVNVLIGRKKQSPLVLLSEDLLEKKKNRDTLEYFII